MTDQDRLADFAKAQLTRYSEYHAHKETMAYVGLALFAGMVGTILVSGEWPPNAWGNHKKILALISLSLAWMAVLIYLRFQLHRRRWAALRVAACERVLARWVTNKLTVPVDVKGWNRSSSSKVSRFCKFVDLVIVPLPGVVKAIKQPKSARERCWPIYPRAFVMSLEQAEQGGTEAIRHEWLVHGTGWLLYLAAFVRTSPDVLNLPSAVFRFVRRLF